MNLVGLEFRLLAAATPHPILLPQCMCLARMPWVGQERGLYPATQAGSLRLEFGHFLLNS